MAAQSYRSLLPLVLLPAQAFCQGPAQVALPYQATLVERDQELDASYGTLKGIHRITPQLRGVEGAGGVVYWVSADKQQLLAYQGPKLLWKTNVAQIFPQELRKAGIVTLVFASETAFVQVGQNGFAEVNRKSGAVTSKAIQQEN